MQLDAQVAGRSAELFSGGTDFASEIASIIRVRGAIDTSDLLGAWASGLGRSSAVAGGFGGVYSVTLIDASG
jgi:hypothetical protein